MDQRFQNWIWPWLYPNMAQLKLDLIQHTDTLIQQRKQFNRLLIYKVIKNNKIIFKTIKFTVKNYTVQFLRNPSPSLSIFVFLKVCVYPLLQIFTCRETRWPNMEESGWEEVRKLRQKAENSRRENGISEQILKMINKDP